MDLLQGPVAQWLERPAHNRLVAGSIPARPTTLSVVEAALSAAPIQPRMFFVYILISEKDRRLYIGLSENVARRLDQHNSGFVIATKNRRPFKLLLTESYSELADAKRRDKYFKGGNGHNNLKIQIQDALMKNNYKYL